MNTKYAALALLSFALAAHAADTQPNAAQVDAAFAKADPDHDGTVSKTEAKKFGITQQAFKSADPDKDGTLDMTEFLAAIKYQFDKANADKDGTLDSKEASKAGVKNRKAFVAADADKDGTLDMAEYLQALMAK